MPIAIWYCPSNACAGPLIWHSSVHLAVLQSTEQAMVWYVVRKCMPGSAPDAGPPRRSRTSTCYTILFSTAKIHQYSLAGSSTVSLLSETTSGLIASCECVGGSLLCTRSRTFPFDFSRQSRICVGKKGISHGRWNVLGRGTKAACRLAEKCTAPVHDL
jgi:hypothetical protein